LDPKSGKWVEGARGVTNTQHLDVQAGYDRWAATYDTTDNPMVYAATYALAAGLSNVKGMDCVEFGCGTGRNLAAMAKAGARTVTGLDLSPAMLAVARARNHDVSPSAWTLIQHDMMLAAPLPGASANFILFALTLEHVDDLVLALQNARRLLRKNGTIRIVEIHPFMSLSGVGAHFIEGDTTVTMPTFPHQFEGWINAIAVAGFVIDSLREWRASDFGEGAPEKLTRRGLHWPWLVDFTLRAR
jgi:ubiquinone/menaquinone biosynthesis C-methylase UbiE